MKTRLNLYLIRVIAGIVVYLATLGLATIATYVLVLGPQGYGDAESWPLVFYFVVPFFGTVLVALGIIAAIRNGPGLMRRVL